MENVLAQIIGEMLIAQSEARRLNAELEALKALHAKCPAPEVKPEDIPGTPSAGVAIQEAAAVNGQSA